MVNLISNWEPLNNSIIAIISIISIMATNIDILNVLGSDGEDALKDMAIQANIDVNVVERKGEAELGPTPDVKESR